MAKNSHFARAFTLIEVIVVLAIIAILMSMVYPMYTSISERAKATKDMSNLRQIGMATQTYMNDSDGVLPGSITPPVTWMSQLSPKYFSGWRGFQSPFDKRTSSETGDASTPISYGVNANIYPGGAAMPASKITKPTAFILFAPAQMQGAGVSFQGTASGANSGAPQGVRVLGIGSTPGGNAIGGTQNNRQRINALFADLHCETMPWATFTNNVVTAGDPDGELRWKPYTPYP
jgi:prepilin-type N-terminal cleavage/methylation domain-containing protein